MDTTVRDGLVVGIDYVMSRANGETVDTTQGEEPLELLQGAGEVIAGLEKALAGMQVGESKHVVVPPDEGFGPYEDNGKMSVPRADFPDDLELEPGMELYVQSEDDEEPLEATVVSVDGDAVVIDFNHPLADETLHIDVTVLSLREPTPEELEHGHVHGDEDDDEGWDEEWEEDEEDEEDEEAAD